MNKGVPIDLECPFFLYTELYMKFWLKSDRKSRTLE